MASSFSNSFFTLEPSAASEAAASPTTTDESGRQSSPSVTGSEQTTKSTNTNSNKNNKNQMSFSSASHYINDDVSQQGDHHSYNDSDAPSSDEDGDHIMGSARYRSPATMAKSQTTSSKPPKSRRRGTATTIKAPKRARAAGGGVKKATAKGAATIGGGGSRKKIDTSMTNLSNEFDDGGSLAGSLVGGQDGGGGSGMSESDSGPYCICGGPDNHRFMIACDRCEDWFHGECINMDKYTGENLVQRYICPRCEVPGTGLVTRYKKMCSLDGCNNPAKIYEDVKEERSIFCSPEHCNAWWDQLVLTLPRTREVGMDNLTRQEFMGLLNPPQTKPGHEDPPWHLGDEPFGMLCSHFFIRFITYPSLPTPPLHHCQPSYSIILLHSPTHPCLPLTYFPPSINPFFHTTRPTDSHFPQTHHANPRTRRPPKLLENRQPQRRPHPRRALHPRPLRRRPPRPRRGDWAL